MSDGFRNDREMSRKISGLIAVICKLNILFLALVCSQFIPCFE